MKNTYRFIKEIYEKWAHVYCLLVAGIVLFIDYITGENIQFPITYVIPAAMAAWRNKRIEAYLFAIVLPMVRIGFYVLWNETQLFSHAIVNSMINAVALSCYVYLIDLVASQTRALRKKLNVLEGILPICISCKKIRNAAGEYEQLEQYITDRSEALFSHGFCPECMKKCYPDYERDKKA